MIEGGFVYVHNATLIQNVRNYSTILKEYWQELLDTYAYTGIDDEHLLKWIINEELELVYGLFDSNHAHNSFPETLIHAIVNLNINLSALTKKYVKAPRIYDNNIIRVSIQNNDLHIEFYQSVSENITLTE